MTVNGVIAIILLYFTDQLQQWPHTVSIIGALHLPVLSMVCEGTSPAVTVVLQAARC